MRKVVLAFGLALVVADVSASLSPAGAQEQGGQARAFDIAPQSLSSALRQFVAQSGLQLAYTTAEVADLQTKGVRGTLSPRAALTQLLAGTGISYRVTGQNTVALRRPPEQIAVAQGAIPLDTINVTGESAWGPIDGYVATRSGAGSKSDTPIIETPQSISVITSDQMKDRATQTVVETLQYTPGINTHPGGKDPRYDQFNIRGFGGQGSGGYRDGLRELGDTNNFGYPRTEPYGLERIDVLRGPASVLYGQSNPGGLIDKISKRPTGEPVREVVGLVGDYERYQGAFDLAGAIDKDKQFQFRVTGLVRDADAQIAHFSNFVKDDRQYIAPVLTWQPTGDTKFTLLSEVLHDLTGNAFPVSAAKLTGATVTGVSPLPIFLGDPNWNQFDQTQYRVGYEFEHRFSDAFTARQKLRYSSVDLDYRYLTGFPINSATTFSRTANWITEKTDGVTVDNQLQVNKNTGPLQHTIVLGIDYQRLGLDGVTKIGPGPSLNINNPVYYQPVTAPTNVTTSTDQTLWQLGAYAQNQIKFANWVLTLGGRYDWADLDSTNRIKSAQTVTDDQAFTKRIGLTYLFASGIAPYASYSESFLPTPGTTFAGDPFKPTTGQQYEGGIKYQPPGTKMLFTAAYFDITQQNVLTPDPAHLNFKVQTGEIRSRGFEAQASVTLADGLDVVAAYTAMEVEVTASNTVDLGKVPVVTPERMASLWADYTLPTGPLAGLGFGAGVRYIGSSYMDAANTLANDPYTVYDAALHYEIKGARFALNVSNIFDKEQAICTTANGCQYISPRTVMASARYKW